MVENDSLDVSRFTRSLSVRLPLRRLSFTPPMAQLKVVVRNGVRSGSGEDAFDAGDGE